jgi:hypothetical protein
VKETEQMDEKIFSLLEKIEFKDGKKAVTLGEAKLLFAYKVGFDLYSIYVIALTENCGAVVFYIPGNLEKMISARAMETTKTLEEYIFWLIEYYSTVKKFDVALSDFGMGCEAAAEALLILSRTVASEAAKPIELRVRPNNWLKFHGYTMRRRWKGRKNE